MLESAVVDLSQARKMASKYRFSLKSRKIIDQIQRNMTGLYISLI